MAYERGRGGGELGGADIAKNFMDGALAFGRGLRMGQELEEGRLKLDDEHGMRQAYEHLAGKLGQNGDISQVEGDPILNTRHGLMALGRLTKDRADTQASRLSMLKNMEASDDKLYRDVFRPLASQAQDAYQRGDMKQFGALVGQLSKVSPFPYQYSMGEDGNFTEQFRSTEQGGWVDTGARMTPQQVFDSVRDLLGGEVKMLRGANMREEVANPNFLAAAARYRMGTIKDNAEALADPRKWVPLEKNGHIIYAIPQNSHTDYSAEPACLIQDDKGGTRYGSMKELLASGYTPLATSSGAAKALRVKKGVGEKGGDGDKDGAGRRRLSAGQEKLIQTLCTTEDENGNAVIDTAKAAVLTRAAILNGAHPYDVSHEYDARVREVAQRLRERNSGLDEAQSRALAGQLLRVAFYRGMAAGNGKAAGGGNAASGNGAKPAFQGPPAPTADQRAAAQREATPPAQGIGLPRSENWLESLGRGAGDAIDAMNRRRREY